MWSKVCDYITLSADSPRTLEQLGFIELARCNHTKHVYKKNNFTLILEDNGSYILKGDAPVYQHLHSAIALKMKELGYWR